MNAGPLDRVRAASNGQVAWRDVAAFTLLALLVLRVVGLLLLQGLFPRAPTFVLDLVDNYTPLFAAVIMLVLVSREGLRGSLGPLGPGRLYVLAVLIPGLFTVVAALVAVVVGSGRLVAGTAKPLWSVVPVLLAGTLLSVFGEEYGWRIGPKEIRRFCCAARLLFLTEMVRSASNCRSGQERSSGGNQDDHDACLGPGPV